MEKSISTWWKKYRVIEWSPEFFEVQFKPFFGCWTYVKYAKTLEIAKEKAIEHKNEPSNFELFWDFIKDIYNEIKNDFNKGKGKTIYKL